MWRAVHWRRMRWDLGHYTLALNYIIQYNIHQLCVTCSTLKKNVMRYGKTFSLEDNCHSWLTFKHLHFETRCDELYTEECVNVLRYGQSFSLDMADWHFALTLNIYIIHQLGVTSCILKKNVLRSGAALLTPAFKWLS